MLMYDLIVKKKRGQSLTEDEIDFLARGYLSGEIPDYQMSSFLMAAVLKGMDEEETVALTRAIEESGDRIDLSHLGSQTVDKHSTGGVGDKTTLILAPIVAAAGARVAKMSGRGLGHTGGTVDKLESFPGFSTSLSAEAFDRQVSEIGLAVTGQSGNLAPLDKKLYALRDVTATVDSLPLIASSIMGKKLASGARSIVLDVKYGSGSFMKSAEDAKALAEAMVKIGKSRGRRVSALITSMESPLGRCVGNILEVKEAIAFLKGDAPEDLYRVCIALATEMVHLALCIEHKEAERRCLEVLRSGEALDKLCAMISAQGGDAAFVRNPSLFPEAKYQIAVKAPFNGYIAAMDSEVIGGVCVTLGGGRSKKEDSIDYTAGIEVLKKTGDRVRAGDTVAILHTRKEDARFDAVSRYLSALTPSHEPPEAARLIYGKIN